MDRRLRGNWTDIDGSNPEPASAAHPSPLPMMANTLTCPEPQICVCLAPPSTPVSQVIGIAGGTGSGKSTLAKHLSQAIGAEHCAVIEHDRYYRDHPRLSVDERRQLDYDHPAAIETALLIRHLHDLRSGRRVELPHYDYARHRRAPEVTSQPPTRILIIEGLFVLADARLRRALNLKIFVHTPDDVRLLRRIKRDTTERGQALAEVLERYEKHARPGHERHVEPSRRHADLIWDQANDDGFPTRLLERLRPLA
jgi:uridine kinase